MKDLFFLLYSAQTEDDLDKVIDTYPVIFHNDNWFPLGGDQNMFGIVRSQQSSPIAALVEKVTNCIDALLMKKCFEAGIVTKSSIAPHTMDEAIQKFFPDNKQWDLQTFRRKQSEEIQIIADGPPRQSAVIIYDNGEGQHPHDFEETFLSLVRGNKINIHFVQGKLNFDSKKLRRSDIFVEKESTPPPSILYTSFTPPPSFISDELDLKLHNGQVHGHYTSEFITRKFKYNSKKLRRSDIFVEKESSTPPSLFYPSITPPPSFISYKLRKSQLEEINKRRKESIGLESEDTSELLKSFAKNLPKDSELFKLLQNTLKLEEHKDKTKTEGTKSPKQKADEKLLTHLFYKRKIQFS